MGGVSFAAEHQVFVDDVRAAVVCTPLVPLWTRRVPLPLAILQAGGTATCIAPATLGHGLRLEFAFGTGGGSCCVVFSKRSQQNARA